MIAVMAIVCTNFIQQVNFTIGLQVTGDVEEAQSEWEKRSSHLAFFDAEIYPQGKPDDKIQKVNPRDLAKIPNGLYEKAFLASDDVDGKVAREVALNYVKVEITQPGEFETVRIPSGDQYMEVLGVGSPYISMFLNNTPRLELADCPYCNGDGCEKCDFTGKWGEYPPPRGGGLVISQYYMNREDMNLTLFYDSEREKWVGTNVTAFYDLEGAGVQGEYALYSPGYMPPADGVQLQIIGVLRTFDPSFGLVALDDAWTLKGMEDDRFSSFLYVRIPSVLDFGEVNQKLSPFYPQFNVFVLYPQIKNVQAVINILQWELPTVAGLVALLIFLNMMQMSVYERLKEVGTMRALGAETTTAIMIFAFEGIAIGGLGGLIGYAAASIISLATKFGGLNPDLNLVAQIGPGKLIMGLAFGLMIAFIGSVLPAFFAIAKSPDDCLRGAR